MYSALSFGLGRATALYKSSYCYYYYYYYEKLEEGMTVDLVYLDFAKAFHMIPNIRLGKRWKRGAPKEFIEMDRQLVT